MVLKKQAPFPDLIQLRKNARFQTKYTRIYLGTSSLPLLSNLHYQVSILTLKRIFVFLICFFFAHTFLPPTLTNFSCASMPYNTSIFKNYVSYASHALFISSFNLSLSLFGSKIITSGA